jgi:hypothetical protein
MKIFEFFLKYLYGEVVGAGAGAKIRVEIFDKLEPELHKKGPAPQHCIEIFIAWAKQIPVSSKYSSAPHWILNSAAARGCSDNGQTFLQRQKCCGSGAF